MVVARNTDTLRKTIMDFQVFNQGVKIESVGVGCGEGCSPMTRVRYEHLTDEIGIEIIFVRVVIERNKAMRVDT